MRLAAGDRTSLVAGTVSRLTDFVDELYNHLSETGKSSATVEDARAAVLHLYILLGEIGRLTGFTPVTALTDGSALEAEGGT